MLRKLKRQQVKKAKKIDFRNIQKRIIASSLLIAYTTFIVPPAMAQQIVPDGRTATIVDVNGAVSNVSTSTVHGINAFNSFTRFNVYEGNTVNLVVPNSAANLINLINGETSHIDGMLNSLKNGQIGGNVYLLNPYGVLFGKNSTVNVGSLNVFTPTKEQMNKYMDFEGNINDLEVGKLLDGEVALTDSGLITVDGKINAQKDVTLAAGNINIGGDILSGAVFEQNKVDFSDVVNVNGYDSASMDMVVENGEFVIKAVNDVEISGKVVNDGADGLDAGDIDIKAGNDINVEENAIISAKGRGEASNGGNITIWADNDATFSNNAIIDVKGGDISGDGGFTEFSAKHNVNLNGGIFEAYATNGETGTILIDPENLYITTDQDSNGANILLEADELIDIASGVTISSRKLGPKLVGMNYITTNTGNSGDINLNAKNINMGTDSSLRADVDEGSSYSAGDITLTAYADRNSPVYTAINSTIDIGEGAVIKGNNVTLNSTADSTHYFDEDTSSFIDTPLVFLDNFSVFAGYSEVKAESKINIGNNVLITSANNFVANATTKTDAEITTTTTGVGVSIAKVDSDANIILGDNVSINSGNDININAYNESKLGSSVTAYYFGDSAGLSTNITVAYGNMNADTKVDISDTSNLTAGSNINIDASTYKNMSVSATSNCYEDGKAGVSVAVSTSEVNNTVDAGGTLKAKNIEINSNVTVVDKYDNYNDDPDSNFEAGNSVKASTDVGSGIGGKIMVPIAKNTGLKDKMSGWFGSKDQSTTKASSGGTKLALAGGVAYGNHTNNATLNIKENSVLEAEDLTSGSGNIILNSETKEMVEVSAKSFVNPQDDIQKENAVSVAVAISTFNNNSETKIGDGSVLNASHDIEVKSTHKMPYHITWDEINGVSDIVEKLNGDLGIQNGIFTTWARSTVGTSDGDGGSGDGIGMAGAVNIADFNSTSKAIIGENVSINQDEALRTDTQKLIVDAKSEAQTVNFAGIVGLTFFGTDAGKGGVGGSYIDIGYNNDVQAIINSDSIIDANYLKVNADSSVDNLSIAASAGKAGKYAFSGSFGFLDIDNTTLAQIDSDSIINIGNIDGFSEDDEIENGLEVTATDNSKAMNITGGVVKSQNVGIGTSLSVSEINRTTQAIIGKNLEDESVKDSLVLTTDSSVLAKAENTGLISTWGLAGAIVTNEPESVGSEDASSKGGAEGSGKFGLAVSGDVGLSTIDEAIKAYVNDVILDTQAHNLDINAISDNSIEAVSGSAALAVSLGQGKSVGIAGSYSSNVIDSDIEAFILNSDINNSTEGGDITLTSDYTGDIWAISAGASGAIAVKSLAVAGSVSINDLDVNNSNYIKESSIQNVNDISLTSTNDADLEAYGGVLAGSYTSGVGAALGLNSIGKDEENTNLSYITGSTITNAGNIDLNSISDNKIETVTGSIGIGKTAGIAVSVSLNEINNNTSAYVKDSNLTTGGALELESSDTSTIEATVASVAVSGTVAAGASVVTNDIENKIKAYIDSSNTDVTDNISLSAESDNIIDATSLAFSASGKVGLEGSGASNVINNEIKSYIIDSNGTNEISSETGTITLLADDSSEIKSIAGTAVVSGIAGVGASVATNDIDNEISTSVDNSTLTADGGIDLSSTADGTIETISAGGAGAGTASAAAAVSVNEINNTISSSIKNGSIVNSDGKVSMASEDTSTIKAYVGGVSGAGTAGFGGSVVTNTISNTVKAYIDNSTVNTTYDDIEISAISDSDIDSLSACFAGAGTLAVSGATSFNNITNETLAYIANNSNIDSGNSITVNASDTSAINSIAGGAALSGGAGLAASYAQNDINNTTEAYVDDSDLVADLNINITSITDQEIDSIAAGGAISIYASISGAIALNDITNTTNAYIGDGVTVSDARNLTIKADADSQADSQTILASAGLASISGVVASSSIDENVSAYIGNSNNVDVWQYLTIETQGKSTVSAETDAVSVGGLNAGATVVDTSININNDAHIGSSNTIDAYKVKVLANQSEASSDIDAFAVAGSLVGANAIVASSEVTGAVNACIDDNSSINNAYWGVDVISSSYSNQSTKTSGTSVGIATAGYVESKTTSNVDVLTELGDNIKLNTGTMNLKANNKNVLYSDVTSGSGGILSGAGAKAITDNDSSSKVIVGAKGSGSRYISATTFNVDAINETQLNSKVDTVNASVVGASGGIADNDSESDVEIKFKDNSKITSGRTNINATNKFVKGWLSGGSYNISSGSGGILDAAAVDSNTDIDNTTKFIMGNNAYLSSNAGDIIVNILNDTLAYDKVKLVSGGAISIAKAVSKINNDDNTGLIQIGENSDIKAAGRYSSINFGIVNNADLNANVKANTYGASGVAKGEALSTIRPDNDITIKNGANVSADEEVNLMIGKTASGDRSDYNVKSNVDLYNATAIPFSTSPDADAKIIQNSKFTVEDNAKVYSAGDINIHAEPGIRMAYGTAKAKNTYSDALSLEDIDTKSTIEEVSEAYINGDLLAGANNIQNIHFDGNGNVISRAGNIGYTAQQLNLQTNILDQIEELEKLKGEYSGVPEAVAAYQNEINRLQQELDNMGLMVDGHPLAANDVDYIILNDVIAGSGNIDIIAEELTGSGSLKANNYAEIKVINDSYKYLRVNDLAIPEVPGGKIYYNYDSVSSNIGNLTITPDTNTADTVIQVSNTYDSNAFNAQYPAPGMDLVGDISNPRGSVTLSNLRGSIDSQGSISGGSISISAGGSFVQSYTDTIFKVGGEPRNVWSSIAADSERGIPVDIGGGITMYIPVDKTIEDVNVPSAGGAITAEGKVIISARYIDVNGEIRSGVAAKDVTINNAVKDADGNTLTFEQAVADYNSRRYGSQYYALTSGQGVYDAKNNVIQLNNIDFNGGYVELYGQIINTDFNGNGKITAIDGFPRFSLDNNTGTKVILNNIDIGDRINGIIKITDLGKGKTYMYKTLNGNVCLYDNATVDSYNNPTHLIQTWSNTQSASYNPVTNSRYVWMTGQRTLTEETYTYEDNSLWGVWDGALPDEESWDKTTRVLDKTPLFEGDFVEIVASSADYIYDRSSQSTNKTKTYDRRWTTSSGWGPWYTETHHIKLKYETGTKYFNKHSIKADNSIGINFEGYSSGLIDVDSVGDVAINGILNNPHGTTDIRSNGSITNMAEIGKIASKYLVLAAHTGLGSESNPIAIDLRDNGYAYAHAYGGDLALEELSGDLKYSYIKADSGDSYLTANGSILEYNGSSYITGDSIYLTSNSGSIGTASNYINLNTKDSYENGVNALAIDNIYLTENSGNLGLIKVESKNGDVNINVPGGYLYDANTNEQRDVATETELLQSWADLYLREEDGALTYAQSTIDNIENTKTQEYKTYWNIRSKQADPSTYDPDFEVTFTDEEVAEYQKMGYTDVQIAEIEDQQTNKYHDLHSDYGSVGDTYNMGWTYQLTAEEKAAMKDGAVWTEDQLRTSISAGIVDGNTDTQLTIEEANIKAKNVNLTVANSVGLDNGSEDIIIDGSVALTDAQKLALMTAEKDDMTLSEDNKTLTVKKFQDIDIDAEESINITANDDVIVGSQEDIKINQIKSNIGDIRLLASKGIMNAASPGVTNIEGNNLILEASDGSIGANSNPLVINIDGKLTARSENSLYINSIADDIRVESIFANQTVELTAPESIIDNDNDDLTDIKAKDIVLTAKNIGSAANTLDLSEINDETAGSLTINATDSIFINNPIDTALYIKDINVGSIANITSTGDILKYNIDSLLSADYIQLDTENNINLDINSGTNIRALAENDIYLNETIGNMNIILASATNGNIITKADNGGITASVTAGGYLRSSARDNINITETSGDMNLDTINSTSGGVDLTASAGSITDYNADDTNITGANVTLKAENGSIDTDVIASGSVTSNSLNNTDIEATAGDINANTIVSQVGDIILKAYNSILDANPFDTANVSGKDLTLTAVNGSIGSLASPLRTLATNKINMNGNDSIYLTKNSGDLISDSITAAKGSIGLTTDNGNVIINHISAVDLIKIIANGDQIDIETIDPKRIDFYVSNEGGNIDLNDAYVSEEVRLAADNINGIFTDTTLTDPVNFYITGNDGNRADLVELNVDASNFEIEKFDSIKANIDSETSVLNWNRVRIGDRLDVTTPTRTILLVNTKGFLDETKGIQLYDTDWFNLTANYSDVTTSAYVINGTQVNTTITDASTTMINTNNDGISKSRGAVEETLNPPDMRDQIQNKRDSIRYSVNTNGIINIANVGNMDIKVLDISSGGAGIQVDTDVPIGQEIELTLNFNGLDINAKTKVVSKQYDEETGTYKLGLKFIDLPEEIADQIPYACMSVSSL